MLLRSKVSLEISRASIDSLVADRNKIDGRYFSMYFQITNDALVELRTPLLNTPRDMLSRSETFEVKF